MSADHGDARRRVCEELARFLATDEGLRHARLLQSLDLLLPGGGRPVDGGAPPPRPVLPPLPARGTKPRAPAPTPIGVWKPETRDGELVFVRGEPAGLGDPWPPEEVLPAKRSPGPRRVCFLGESAAAGWFYAPHLTPARVLQQQLTAWAGAEAWEVVNLAKVDLTAAELIALVASVHQLQPDVLVVFAGNNWPQRYQLPPPGAAGPAEAALAFREGGLAGLRRLYREGSERVAGEVVARLARFAGETSVPVVLVVPEVNLADFDRTLPVPWLPGGSTPAWYEEEGRARGRLSEGDFAGAESAARRMAELDGGLSAAAPRLLARALAGQQRWEEAAEACRQEVDARSWDNHPFVPAVTGAIQGVLRGRGAEHGFRVVDLPALFAEHGTSPLPGRRYFLDYCHLTPEGMQVSMAAVAAEALAATGGPAPAWREIAARGGEPRVAREHDARARFMAALYTRHWTATDAPAPAFEHWIEAALEAWEGVAETMTAYLDTRSAPPEALLFSRQQQRLFSALDRSERHIWSAPHLDPEAVRAVGAALRARGRDAGQDGGHGLLRHHAVGDEPVDLLAPAYQWGLTDQPRANTSLRHNPPAFYAARTPRSHFCLVTEGGEALQLELTARLPVVAGPRTGEVAVTVEGRRAASLELGGGWRRHRLRLGPELLRRGINRLTLEWPPLPPEGDAALARIGLRLDQRVGVDLHPVFGELMRLRAARGAEAR